MNSRYVDWIADNVRCPLGTCREVTFAMQFVFPELRRVRGYYDCVVMGRRPHWWLVYPSGEVVDPTAEQFLGSGRYIELPEDYLEPVGRCQHCGEEHWRVAEMFCSARCSEMAIEYLKTGVYRV